MEHIAIDLGSRESQICRRNAAGDILEERRCGTGELETYLAAQAAAVVVVETCTEAFRIAEIARRCGTTCASSPRRWCNHWTSGGTA